MRAARLTHCEAADHPAREVNVALVRVLTLLELDRPGDSAGSRNAGCLVHAGAEEVEVVRGAFVVNRHLVSARFERLHGRTVVRQRDREAGPRGADEADEEALLEVF